MDISLKRCTLQRIRTENGRKGGRALLSKRTIKLTNLLNVHCDYFYIPRLK